MANRPPSQSAASGLNGAGLVSLSVLNMLHNEIATHYVNSYLSHRHTEKATTATMPTATTTTSVSTPQLKVSSASVQLFHTSSMRSNAEGPAAAGQITLFSLHHRLERIGHHSGLRIAERILHSQPPSRFTPRDAIIFVGKELWTTVFGKRADRLKEPKVDEITDLAGQTPQRRREHFTVVDNNFMFLRSTSFKTGAPSVSSTIEFAPTERATVDHLPTAAGPRDFVVYTSGMIRGCLEALGYVDIAVRFHVDGPVAVRFDIYVGTKSPVE